MQNIQMFISIIQKQNFSRLLCNVTRLQPIGIYLMFSVQPIRLLGGRGYSVQCCRIRKQQKRPRCVTALLLVRTQCYRTPTFDSFVSIFISPEDFLETHLVQSWTLTTVQYNSNQPLSDIQRLCHEWGSAPTKPSSDGCVFPEHSC